MSINTFMELLADSVDTKRRALSQYSFMPDHHRSTRSRCALLGKFFLLLTLSELLFSEFMIDRSYENFLQK